MPSAGRLFLHVKDALSHLNPSEVRAEADRPFTIQIFSTDDAACRQIADWFAPADPSRPSSVRCGADYSAGTVIQVSDEHMPHNAEDFVFRRAAPEQVVLEILAAHPELKLALARQVCPFRAPVAQDIIRSVAKENALFSLATAVPSMLPLLSLPWAAGEFASDTAFLTANQIRMAFMLAAVSDRTIGYGQQKTEIASVFAGAFGWRAIARELVGKIPMGGGLIPKAAIAFAGTYVVGMSLERLYRVGYGYTPEERKAAYAEALERGKEIAASLIRSARAERHG